MTPEEALDILDKTFIGNLEAKIAWTKALEKQIPKKLINKKHTKYDLAVGICPSCNHGLNEDMRFCDNCGQALNWEDEENDMGKD